MIDTTVSYHRIVGKHMVGKNGAGYSRASDTTAYLGQVKKRTGTRRKICVCLRNQGPAESGAISLAVAAQWEAAYGYPERTREVAALALNLAPTSLGTNVEAAVTFALAGDTSRAEAMAQDLN